MPDDEPPSEASIVYELTQELDRLGPGRVLYIPEVWMLAWTHTTRGAADRLRIDYVAMLEGRLIGIEVKAPPDKAADLGRDLLQCAQYAHGVIAPNAAPVPREWVGQPLAAVFLRTRLTGAHQGIRNHALCAHRIYGPANVGFLVKESRGLCLRLCGERFWTEWSGWHQGMLNKAARVGNGQFRPGTPA